MTTPQSRAAALIAATNDATVGAGEALTIGLLTPVTGPGDATAGELIVRAACLGAEYLNERGGVRGGLPVRLVLQNDQPQEEGEIMQRSAVGGLAKLALVDQVHAVIGQWHLRTAPGVSAAAELFGVPLFVENGHSTLTQQRRRTLFRTYFTIADRAPMIADLLVEQGVRKAGILAADTVFGLMNADTIADELTARGVEVLRFDFPQDTTDDVRDQLRAVKDFAPDVLINGGVVRTNYMIIQQAAEVGLLPGPMLVVLFPFPMRSQDYWRLAGEVGNHVIWPALLYRPSWPGLTEIGRWFTERYAERFGSFPPDNALNAFTDVTILGQAADAASELSREALIEALETHEFDTWRGPVRFQRDDQHWHHSPPPIVLMQYQQVGQTFDEATIVYPPEARTGTLTRPDHDAQVVR
ncbi:ABC transporter substrate-binding protein [Micromonospora maris]|uniref:ABC transporter substrate-binding protein n=1 Tax=Micromonospora TaxID=1873 RepID=UPI000206AC0A|nr:ABC transporter substrate-binding protein [Micromonospora maris]AEB45550.1 ABC-type branched-chain amino acid transport systems periplasmic component-like protein [Micromonospora maris AB-18-032]